MCVYGVAKSKVRDRGGRCKDEDREKAIKIVGDVVESEMCEYNFNYSVYRMAQEVESRLNRDSLHWLVIKVREKRIGFCWFNWFDDSNVSYVSAYFDKYFIAVCLSN